MNNMPIDPVAARSTAELNRMSVSGSVSQTDNRPSAAAVTQGSSFGQIFNGLLNQEVSSAANHVVLSPGVTWEDGLLWQQLGSIESAEQHAPASEALQVQQTVSEANNVQSGARNYDELIRAAGEKYGVPVSLIKAVIDTESSFNPNAVSSAGAKGLMQLMDATARGLGVSDSFNPQQNIEAGTKYLSYQLQKFGGEAAMALAAYNAGPSRVMRLGVSNDEELMAAADRLPAETQAYIRKVLDSRSSYAD